MARFPERESEIVTLTQDMIIGFNANPVVYPAPPVATVQLGVLIGGYFTAHNTAVAARAAAEQATTDKNIALDALIDGMKDDLRYAENTVDFDDDKLKLLGWAGRSAPAPLAMPGQARTLEVVKQGDDYVSLDWKVPSTGGAPAAYKIQRRERPGGAWSDVGMALESEAVLPAQERAKEWEYRVLAVNKTGEGPASNTVMAVL